MYTVEMTSTIFVFKSVQVLKLQCKMKLDSFFCHKEVISSMNFILFEKYCVFVIH